MELRVNEYSLPEAISFNFDELKTALTEKVHIYETMVYGDDQIKQAKEDRAELNKLKKALNDERIRMEKEYLVPFNTFKAQINEIIAIIDKPAAIIDQRIKEADQKKKDEKKVAIEELFKSKNLPEYITFDKVFDPGWLNSSISMNRIDAAFEDIRYRNTKNVDAINALPEYKFEAMEFYKKDLDLTNALTQANRLVEIEKAKKAAEEAAARKAEEEARLKAEAEAVKVQEPEPEQVAFTTPESFDKYCEEVTAAEPEPK